MNEAPGILKWMIEGCLDWQAGGLIRIGLCHYSSRAEVDRLLDALRSIVAAGSHGTPQ